MLSPVPHIHTPAYKFTKNIYDIWMPTHLKRICSIIDDLPPDLDFEVSEPGESGFSQGLESHHLFDQTSYDAASLEEADSQSSRVCSRDVTPDTSLTQRIEGSEFKKPRKRGRPVELHQWVASPITSQYFEAYRLPRKVLRMLYGLKVRVLSRNFDPRSKCGYNVTAGVTKLYSTPKIHQK